VSHSFKHCSNGNLHFNSEITTKSVTISTIHIAKGFDYACVFLLGLDWLAPGRWTEEQIRRLAYVAVTRARERLFIPYCSGNELISRHLKRNCRNFRNG